MKKQRIGLALSGGGIRAAIFHLGVLQYLAEAKLYGDIASISTVSGASIAVGLILGASGNRWPSGDEFIRDTLPTVRQRILEHNIQRAALRRLPFSPWYWRNRIALLAKMLEDKWQIHGTLQDLPSTPYWEINCTTFETGGNFRFRQDYMGDSTLGYVQNPTMPLSHVVAASAAFPVLIGPYILDTYNLKFTPDKHGELPPVKVQPQYTLWDGGVYDNLGLDPLYTTAKGLDEEIDFLIVSDASANIGYKVREGHISLSNLRRLLDIAQNQVNELRGGQIVTNVVNLNRGLYLKIGEDINYPTTLNSPRPEDFEAIFRNGYTVAKNQAKIFDRP